MEKIEPREIKGLPVPRLELQWVKLGEGWHERQCIYCLVLPLREHDARRENAYREKVRDLLYVEIGRINDTGGSGRPVTNGKVDTPFKDDFHAKWDAECLGLQLWAVCGDDKTRIQTF